MFSSTGGSTFKPELTGPSMAYVKSIIIFECKASLSTSPPIYDLVKDDGVILATRDDPRQDQPIQFYLKADLDSDGVYFCRVTTRGQKSFSNPVRLQVVSKLRKCFYFLIFSSKKAHKNHFLKCIFFFLLVPVQGAHIVPEPDPPVLYERAGFILRCDVRKGSHLDYDWYHNKQEMTSSSSLYQVSENMIRVDNASERHAGTYSCVAKNRMANNTRYSSSMPVTVDVKSKYCLYAILKC